MELYRSGSGGDPQIAAGSLKRVNSYNVSPITVTATASAGTALDSQIYKNYEFFNTAQTSAGTDRIVLPAGLPVGTELWFSAASAHVIAAGTGETVNGGTDGQAVAVAANGLIRFLKRSSTAWIANAFTSAGAISNPTPS